MRRSSERILTTHAGSLPRPENLTNLFVRRSRGEGVAADEIAAAGRAALRAIVPRQAEAGIDVGNNGEQQRDSFFLYLKERLTGLGGTWQRPSRADVDRYPEFKKRWIEQASSKARVSPNEGLPMAIGDVRYIDAAAIEAEIESPLIIAFCGSGESFNCRASIRRKSAGCESFPIAANIAFLVASRMFIRSISSASICPTAYAIQSSFN